MDPKALADQIERVRGRLGNRPVVLVGLMGAGKTSVGRRLAQLLDMPFADSDHEIEAVSRMSVPELFEAYGEAEFRALEQRVVSRLVSGAPAVIATGGGAYMNAETRIIIRAHAVSVWLKADLDTLMERVSRRANRPLLKAPDPRAVMRKLIADRYPTYAEADITILSRETRHSVIAGEIVEAIDRTIPMHEMHQKDEIH